MLLERRSGARASFRASARRTFGLVLPGISFALLQGCPFYVIPIPGSVTGTISDAVTRSKGTYCVATIAKSQLAPLALSPYLSGIHLDLPSVWIAQPPTDAMQTKRVGQLDIEAAAHDVIARFMAIDINK